MVEAQGSFFSDGDVVSHGEIFVKCSFVYLQKRLIAWRLRLTLFYKVKPLQRCWGVSTINLFCFICSDATQEKVKRKVQRRTASGVSERLFRRDVSDGQKLIIYLAMWWFCVRNDVIWNVPAVLKRSKLVLRSYAWSLPASSIPLRVWQTLVYRSNICSKERKCQPAKR